MTFALPLRARLLSALLLAAGFPAMGLGADPQQQPAPESIYDIWRLRPDPSDGATASLNPPAFKWPGGQDGTLTFVVEVSRDDSFTGDAVIRSQEVPWSVYNLHQKLDEGKWCWRYATIRDGKKAWSPAYTFWVTAETPTFVAPDVATLIKNLPKERPYILAYGLPHDTVIANAKRLPELRDHVIAEGERALEADVIQFTSFDASHLTPRALGGLYSKQRQMLPLLCRAYLVTGDQRYYAAAEKRIREMLEWTSTDGMAVADRWRALSAAYDTFHDELPEDLRRRILDRSTDYLEEGFRMWAGVIENRQFENHFWQVELSAFFTTALATVADRPEHKKYVEYAYEVFLARAPVVGGNSGGWADGLPYFSVNDSTVGDMAYMLQKLAKVDIFSKPWYQNMAEYFIYCSPAAGPMDGFADAHDRRGDGGGGSYLLSFLAVEKQDPKALYQVSQNAKHDARIANAWLQLINGVPELKADPNFNPAELPQARQFQEVGLVAMHTNVQDATDDLAVYFRSSPYGANGHMHANQNCFNLSYKGRRVFYSSGYYTSFADPHTITSYKNTRAHNGILINGRGQAYGHEGYGWIKRFAHGDQITYVCGDASRAYRPVVDKQWSGLLDEHLIPAGLDRDQYFGDARLKTFDRHVAMLRPNTVVIYDVLEAEEPVDWELLLHTYHQSTPEGDSRLTYEREGVYATARVFGSAPIQLDVTDQFAIKPVDILKKYGHGLPNQWHATFGSRAPSKKQRFLTLIQCHDNASQHVAERSVGPGEVRVGEWLINAALDVNDEPALTILGPGAELHLNNAPAEALGRSVSPPTQPATVLAEMIDGGFVSIEAADQPPAIAE